MARITDDQIATTICSLLAAGFVALGVWLIFRRYYWTSVLVIPPLVFLGFAIYYFGFMRFTRLF